MTDIDVSDLDDMFKESDVAQGDGSENPDGDYEVAICGLQLGESYNRNRMVTWRLGIVSGPCTGGTLLHKNTLLTQKNMGFFKKDLEFVGVDTKGLTLTEITRKFPDLVGTRLLVRKEADGQYYKTYFNELLAPAPIRESGPEDAPPDNPPDNPPDEDDMPF